uniref:Ribosome biogenesis protein NOP53 n=1 Tax=Aceria tosichella TaxID=561515 RepID=A0A6G1S480_9ACAR
MELYDLWNDEATQGRKKKSSIKKRDKRPPPHPGQSYNPDPEDHKRLLNKVAQKEIKHIKKKSALNKATNVKVNLKELRQHEKQELVSGIKHLIKKSNDDAQAEESDDSSSTDSAYSDYDEKDFKVIMKDKKVSEKRKTKKQRLAQLRDKLQRKAAKLRKLKNIRSSRFDAIKKILKKLDAKDKEKKTTKRHKKLGYKLPDPDPIYCVSSELPSNLRETKCPLDAIVREQLDSFQSRLMVEPTKYQMKKRDKYKKRQFERE